MGGKENEITEYPSAQEGGFGTPPLLAPRAPRHKKLEGERLAYWQHSHTLTRVRDKNCKGERERKITGKRRILPLRRRAINFPTLPARALIN